MQNQFEFYIPTRILFDSGAIETLPDLSEVKGKKCAVLRFPAFSNQELLSKLDKACEKLFIIQEFEENPTEKLIKSVSQTMIENSVETVIAIGGGSTIDTAKAAVWYAQKVKDIKMSVIAVPTTSGTGSEVTPYAIITGNDSEKHILNDEQLFTDIALCDPELTITMPESVTINTGIDALSHAIEAYLNIKCHGFMKQIALHSCRLVSENLKTAINEPSNIGARENMSLAALEGGIVLARCGTVLVHALGYKLTEKFGYAHGHANAVLLGCFVKLLAKKGSDRANEILDIFGGDLASFISNCGIEAKLSCNISDEFMNEWVQAGYNSYGRVNSFVPIERNDIKTLLESVI